MKRDLRVYLDDILESIELIQEYTTNLTEGEFKRAVEVQDAVVRRLEIIGEAVKHIPDDVRKKYPDVPWKKIAGARDIFVHEYFGVRLERVWDTITNDLPPLKVQIEKFLGELI